MTAPPTEHDDRPRTARERLFGAHPEHPQGPRDFADLVFDIAWVATLILIGFMASLLFLRNVIGDAAMQWLYQWLWLFLLVNLHLQLWGTFQRDSEDFGKFLWDNFLALVGIVLGLGLMIFSKWFWSYPKEEWWMMFQSVAFGLFDFMWGILFALRIGVAGKERNRGPA